MQKSQSRLIQRLKSTLKNKIRGDIADIFIIGSALKNKLSPGDVDIIVLFKNKNLKEIGEILYDIKESLDFIKEAHIEPIFSESMFTEKIFITIMHEGFSIKENEFVSKIIGLESLSIFTYRLENLSKLDKIRFAQTIYGRKKDGLLYQERGISLGQGSFMVSVEKEEIFKELMKKWEIKYKSKRAFVNV